MADETEKVTKVGAAAEQVVVLTNPIQDPEKKPMTSPPIDDPKSHINDSSSSPAIGSSFRECLKISDLPENEKKALVEFKLLIQDALKNHQLIITSSPPQQQSCPATPPPQKQPSDHEEQGEKPAAKETTTDTNYPAADDQNQALNVAETKPLPLPEEHEMKKKEGPEKSGADDENAKDPVTSEESQVKEVIPEETVIAAADTQQRVTHHKDIDDESKTVEAIKETIKSVVSESSSPKKDEEKQCSLPEEENVTIYGIPLLEDERSDTILWKFLRARDFKVKDAFTMLKATLKWRKEFKIDELVENEEATVVGNDSDVLGKRVVFMDGVSKEGHPVCYNVYGEFQDKELYMNTFSDEEKRGRFLKWRVLFLEKSIRKLLRDLELSPGGVSSFVQVNDLKNSPGPSKWELRQATKQALNLLQDNYPEFVAKQVFINVPWWYMAVHKMISPFLTQRTKSKFVFAGPSKSPETLFNYISAEQVPVQYGGLSRKDGEFSATDVPTQIIIKPSSKETVEFSANEKCQISWELRVLGWDVSYGAEFVPYSKDSYTVIIQKIRKVGPSDETVITTNGFKVTEPGKIVLTIDNASSKKKRLVYRLKSKPASASSCE